MTDLLDLPVRESKKPAFADVEGQSVKQVATSGDGAANVICWMDGAPHLFIDGIWAGTGTMAMLRSAADSCAAGRQVSLPLMIWRTSL